MAYEDLLAGELPRPKSRTEALLMRLINSGGGGSGGGPGEGGWASDGDIDGLFDGSAQSDSGEPEDGYADDDDIDALFDN